MKEVHSDIVGVTYSISCGETKNDLCQVTAYGIISPEFHEKDVKVVFPINGINFNMHKGSFPYSDFREVFDSIDDSILELLIKVAIDVIEKCSIYMHFVYKFSHILMIILRNKMNIEKKNLYLFKTYFH